MAKLQNILLGAGVVLGAALNVIPGLDRLAQAVEPKLSITQPVAWQVIQRTGYVPAESSEHAVAGRKLGYADVPVALAVAELPDDASLEARLVQHAASDKVVSDWTPLADLNEKGATITGHLRVPAGGWYRLEIRARADGPVTVVEPIGVGEVLIIAGQSYAAGANDELLKVTDRAQRVSAWDPATGLWQVAHDPQPGRGDGGTIWPPLGDHLAGLLDVPIGFVNVAVGGTASRQWLPGESLYNAMVIAAKAQPGFRAVLWQQGESDVIENVSTEKYVENLIAIRAGLQSELKRDVAWLLAKSTLHPTVYKRPEGEAIIRRAIDELVEQHGFRPGPDTDRLGGENRGGPETRRHFSGIGQRRAALMWLIAVANELER